MQVADVGIIDDDAELDFQRDDLVIVPFDDEVDFVVAVTGAHLFGADTPSWAMAGA